MQRTDLKLIKTNQKNATMEPAELGNTMNSIDHAQNSPSPDTSFNKGFGTVCHT